MPGRVVVIGAGPAGVSAVEELRASGYDGRVALVGAEDQLPYDRPPLSKDVLRGTAGAPEIRLHPGSWYAEHAVELRLGVAAREIRTAEGLVVLGDGSAERADAVLLATGGTPRALAAPGAEHPVVVTLRTWRDAERLRAALRPGARVGVVGAGLIGSEVAASAVSLGCEVTVLDPGGPPLVPVVGPEIAAALHARHGRHGMRVLHTGVRAVEDRGDRVRLHHDGGVVTCDVVVVGIGIELDLSLAFDAGLAVDDGVLVDDAQRTSNPHVFAAGDVARRTGRARVEHWDAARRAGRAAARGLLGLPAPEPEAPWFRSDRHHVRLECVGEFTGADETVVRGALDGDFTAIGLRGGRLAGAVAVNRTADITALRRLVGQPLDADLLRDGSVDLPALARAGQRRQGATT